MRAVRPFVAAIALLGIALLGIAQPAAAQDNRVLVRISNNTYECAWITYYRPPDGRGIGGTLESWQIIKEVPKNTGPSWTASGVLGKYNLPRSARFRVRVELRESCDGNAAKVADTQMELGDMANIDSYLFEIRRDRQSNGRFGDAYLMRHDPTLMMGRAGAMLQGSAKGAAKDAVKGAARGAAKREPPPPLSKGKYAPPAAAPPKAGQQSGIWVANGTRDCAWITVYDAGSIVRMGGWPAFVPPGRRLVYPINWKGVGQRFDVRAEFKRRGTKDDCSDAGAATVGDVRRGVQGNLAYQVLLQDDDDEYVIVRY